MTMKPLINILIEPIDFPVVFWTIMATISIPPVEKPILNVKPIEIPNNRPPNKPAKIGSWDTKEDLGNTICINEAAKLFKNDKIVNLRPAKIQPAIASGIFDPIIIAPTSICIPTTESKSKLISCDTPLTPPEKMLFDMKKLFIEMSTRTSAKTNTIVFIPYSRTRTIVTTSASYLKQKSFIHYHTKKGIIPYTKPIYRSFLTCKKNNS